MAGLLSRLGKVFNIAKEAAQDLPIEALLGSRHEQI